MKVRLFTFLSLSCLPHTVSSPDDVFPSNECSQQLRQGQVEKITSWDQYLRWFVSIACQTPLSLSYQHSVLCEKLGSESMSLYCIECYMAVSLKQHISIQKALPQRRPAVDASSHCLFRTFTSTSSHMQSKNGDCL